MERPDPREAARRLVAGRFPDAVQAWLAGSVVQGGATATSDLDVTVVLPEGAGGAPYRHSVRHEGWPVELFVHTAASARHYVARDVERGRPTMARLVAAGVPLLPGDGGADLRAECARVLAAGPGPLPTADLDARRYALTDLLDDLRGGGPERLAAAVSVAAWHAAAELLLLAAGRWSGTGKWLVRELEAYDAAAGSAWTPRLHAGLVAAVGGERGPLAAVVAEALDEVGGPLWEGYRVGGEAPDG